MDLAAKFSLLLLLMISSCNSIDLSVNPALPPTVPGPTPAPTVQLTEDEQRYHKLSSGLGSASCLIQGPDQHVMCWGNNASGQLGNNSTVASLTPVQVLDETLSVLTEAASITGGDNHNCVVMKNKTVKCWGAAGNLGLSDNLGRLVATPVPGLTGIVAIESSDYHTCAVTSARELYCWGLNNRGQIGNGNVTNQITPVKVPGLSSVRMVSVSPRATCAVLYSGLVYCWGENFNGALMGDATMSGHLVSPQQVPNVSNAKTVSATNPFLCASLQDNKTVCWGYSFQGALPVVGPRDIPEFANALELTAGFNFICARKAASIISCVGSNSAGQLGDGTTTPPVNPTAVVSLPFGEVLVEVQGYDTHTCSRFQSGRVFCWGAGGSGKLGNGATANSSIPVEVQGL